MSDASQMLKHFKTDALALRASSRVSYPTYLTNVKTVLEGDEMARSELYAGILAGFLDPVAFR